MEQKQPDTAGIIVFIVMILIVILSNLSKPNICNGLTEEECSESSYEMREYNNRGQ